MRRVMKLWALALATLICSLSSAPATAQQPVPPTHYSTDERGVDLTNGGYFPFVTEVVIGQPGAGGLVYGRSHIGTGWRDALLGTLNSTGNTVGSTWTVSVGPHSDAFMQTNAVASSFSPLTPNGSTLAYNTTLARYVYTTSTGVEVQFAASAGVVTPYEATQGLATQITAPNGEILTYAYEQQAMCFKYASGQCRPGTSIWARRLVSVTNNRGYQIKYFYHNNGNDRAQQTRWMSVSQVLGINRGVDFCADSATTCTYSMTWPSVAYSDPLDTDPHIQTVTDEMGRVTTYGMDGSGRLVSIRLPGSTADNVTVSYDANGRVDTLTDASGAWDYSFSTSGGSFLADVNGPNSQAYDTAAVNGRITSYTNAAGDTTEFDWGSGLLDSVTYPEGNGLSFVYDARGNVIETINSPKPNSGLSAVTIYTAFPTTCTDLGVDITNCNLPLSTTDARGFTTNYSWSIDHGGLLSVTSPAPYSTGDRPETRITYGSFNAYYRSSATTWQNGSAVTLPVEVSACATGAPTSCDGTAAEVVTTVAYGSTGVMNNLLPTVVSSGAGNASPISVVTTSWTPLGDVLEVDGPLSGTYDRTQYRYNANRELTDVIGPDPDGSATSAPHRAMRITRNSVGLPTLVEQGTTPSYASPAWPAFTSLQQVATTYDNQGRPIGSSLSDGSTIYSLVQYSYDTSGRPYCTAIRMNPAEFLSPPTSACTADTAGSFGPDRISQSRFNSLGLISEVVSGLGQASAIVESVTYTDNGLPLTVTDGEGNVTTYAYDGLDRLAAMYYPNASGGGSSTTDYEAWTYWANGAPYTFRNRSGDLFAFWYDDLSRLTYIDAPSGMRDTQGGYDNLGRRTWWQTVGTGGQTLLTGYDPLGRPLWENGPLGTIAYQWDAASQLLRITWPDNYGAGYDYDYTGALVAVSENSTPPDPGELVNYAYDNLGRMTGVARHNGVSTTYTWDGGSRLTGLAQNLSGTTDDQTFTLGYNPAGQVVSRVATNDLYAYTANANVSDSYTINGRNQVTAIDSTSVTYDSRGNLTSDGTTSFAYDAANRLASAGAASFDFDPTGRLYSTTADSVTRRFLYSGTQVIAEFDGSGTLVTRYVPGAGIDSYAAYVEPGKTRPIGRTYPVADWLGSVIGLTNSSGASVQINAYDEYGVPALSNAGRFGYTGQLFIPQAGTAPFHYRARQYHPGIGRFLQTDPMGYGAGLNSYEYVRSDPVNFIDPMGTQEGRWQARVVCRVKESTGYGRELVSRRQIFDCERQWYYVNLGQFFPGGEAWSGPFVGVDNARRYRDEVIPRCPTTGGLQLGIGYGGTSSASTGGGNAVGGGAGAEIGVFIPRGIFPGIQFYAQSSASATAGRGTSGYSYGPYLSGGVRDGPMGTGTSVAPVFDSYVGAAGMSLNRETGGSSAAVPLDVRVPVPRFAGGSGRYSGGGLEGTATAATAGAGCR